MYILMIKMKHTVALSGSYDGNTDKLFRSIPQDGVLQMSLVGREITLHVRSESLEMVKDFLSKAGVSNLSIVEWKKAGVTLSNPGKGIDSNEIIQISLIPTALDEGIRPLALLSEFELNQKILEKIRSRIEETLEDAGITDAIYTIHMRKKVSGEEYVNAAMIATLNAIFEAGGVVSIE